MIKLTRLDERLIHGQVAFAWTNSLGANCIFIVNDSVASDAFRKSSLKLACPPGVKLVVKNVESAKKALAGTAIDKYNVFLIVDNTKDALELVQSSPKIREIDLGNMKSSDNRKEITNSIFMDDRELTDVRKMRDIGASVYCQSVPSDSKIDPLGGD